MFYIYNTAWKRWICLKKGLNPLDKRVDFDSENSTVKESKNRRITPHELNNLVVFFCL